MAKIAPFKGIHYNPEIVEDIGKVICPPYDVIDAKEQEELYQRHPYNMIRMILGKDLAADNEGQNKYLRASQYLQEWQRRTILVQDAQPGIFFYEQVFAAEGGDRTRLGFVALLGLGEEGGRTVHPHEHTHAAPKEDRFRLIQAVEADLDSIFTIFSDPEKIFRSIFDSRVRPLPPLFDVVDARGERHRVWQVAQQDVIDELIQLISPQEIFIADGHHRYEVARMYRDLKRREDPQGFNGAADFVMAYFTPLEDEGLCILPTHRLVKNARFSADDLGACFNVKKVETWQKLAEEMKDRREEVGVFGLYKDGQAYLLRMAEKRECNRFIPESSQEFKNLDVVILHRVIFDNLLKVALGQIAYEVDLAAAVRAVDAKSCDALFALNPTKAQQIRSIALGGQVMPQKSTYFYPKLMAGFFLYKF